ncbi:hypothetical protein K490DRAFT_35218 [Saccharata proteae CBS 121410]|uniref:F-box domain-containing protein n=1 Tax=Saccharata proteae CBS 121410 TaxID=1314787 RepID=A0A9P4LYI8_9PEZI|nr:hypothetical protein K490DRAFT_35218 [Saccharata proteae CBS 121410]
MAATDEIEDLEDSDVESPPPKPFRFFDLPSEIRLRVYELLLHVPGTVDLDPINFRRIKPRFNVFLVSRRMHEEAYRVFYGHNTFRLFPIHGRFFHTKKPLLMRLAPHHRAAITNLELRLGPGWTGLPTCWAISDKLGIEDMTHWRVFKIFVECDPASDNIFKGFRKSENWFTHYCTRIVHQIWSRAPSIQEVQFDAFPAVPKDSPLMLELLRESREHHKKITWGPERGWKDDPIMDLVIGLQHVKLDSIAIDCESRG